MVLRNSGQPDARRDAAEALRVALMEAPEDPLGLDLVAQARHALGDCHVKIGAYLEGMKVLEPLSKHSSRETREKTYPLLLECYENLTEVVKAARLKERMRSDGLFPEAF